VSVKAITAPMALPPTWPPRRLALTTAFLAVTAAAAKRFFRASRLRAFLPGCVSTSELSKQAADAIFALIRSPNQSHVLARLRSATSPSHAHAMLQQLADVHSRLEGGIEGYITRSRDLLAAHLRGDRPFKDFSHVDVPGGEKIDFASNSHLRYEAEGLNGASSVVYVLVAGGVGERLGYSGQSKLELPTELCTKTSFLQLFIESILSLRRSASSAAPKPLLAIMTSEDTHEAVETLLERNRYFGLDRSDVTLLQQKPVPCFRSYAGDLELSSTMERPLLELKPQGHGDVHNLVYRSGLAHKWRSLGVKHCFFFQDTNPLTFRSLLPAVGYARSEGLSMCSVAVPRAPKEAIGGIAKLSKPDGTAVTVNVEYNVLDALMRASNWPCGDVARANERTSPFPGNINQLCLRMDDYSEILKATKGMVPEGINPKVNADNSFKKAARAERLMQDIALLFKPSMRHGFVELQASHAYSPVKNAPEEAMKKDPSHSATTSELDVYRSGCFHLSACGAAIGDAESTPTVTTFNGISDCEVWPLVVLKPAIAPSLQKLQEKVRRGSIKLTQRSSLVLNGWNILIENLHLDGALVLSASKSATVRVDATVSNKGWRIKELGESGTDCTEAEYLRGFTIEREETREEHFEEAGEHMFRG